MRRLLLLAAFIAVVPSTGFAGTAFRITDINLRDPHVYVPGFLGCQDISDNPLSGYAFNASLADAISLDENGDGYFDASIVLWFPVLDQSGPGADLWFGDAMCTSAPGSTTCMIDTTTMKNAAYANATAGRCLEPLAGTVLPYAPAVSVVDAPCFHASIGNYTFDLGGFPMPLADVEIAGEWVGTTGINVGLFRGFLAKNAADAITIPPGVPVLGGLSLSSIFPGGPGNCAGHSDLDIGLDGVTEGWWCYFNYIATVVESELPTPVRSVTWGELRALYRSE